MTRSDAGNIVAMLAECPKGYRRNEVIISESASHRSFSATCTDSIGDYQEPNCDACPGGPAMPEPVGNPIYPSTGLKRQVEVDYRSSRPGGLEFVRTYRSDRNGWQHNYHRTGGSPTPTPFSAPPEVPVGFPYPSTQCYSAIGERSGKRRCFQLLATDPEAHTTVQRAGGRVINLNVSGGALSGDVKDRWASVLDEGGNTVLEVLNALNDSTERYNQDGMVERITDREGRITKFVYAKYEGPRTSDTPKTLLQSVTDHFGKSLTLTYDSNARLASMKTPEGHLFKYAYDEPSSVNVAQVGNLTSVTYPDNTRRTYWYNEPTNTSGVDLPFALTGITDENGSRYATYKYNTSGKAFSTEHAGGVGKFSVAFSWASFVTDPQSVRWQYEYITVLGSPQLKTVTRPAVGTIASQVASYFYEANGNVSSYTDLAGSTTTYTYDLARNLELTKTEASGKSEQRKITTEWHPGYKLPLRIAEPKRLTTYSYFANGLLKSRSVQATTDLNGAQGLAATLTGKARLWTYTYNANAQLETIIGPRTDVVDKTIFIYSSATGDLLSTINVAGHETRYAEYNEDGKVGLITQPNGVATRMAYTSRGWIDSVTVGTGPTAIRTSYVYDNVGQVKSISTNGSGTINYSYDDAHRLIDITDSLGNNIHYVLDNAGNRTSELVTDPNGVLTRQLTRQYDALNNLKVQTGGNP